MSSTPSTSSGSLRAPDSTAGPVGEIIAKRLKVLTKKISRIKGYDTTSLNADQRASIATLPLLEAAAEELQELVKPGGPVETTELNQAARIQEAQQEGYDAAKKENAKELHDYKLSFSASLCAFLRLHGIVYPSTGMPGLLPGWLRGRLCQDDANLIKDLYDGLQAGGDETARAIEYLYTDARNHILDYYKKGEEEYMASRTSYPEPPSFFAPEEIIPSVPTPHPRFIKPRPTDPIRSQYHPNPVPPAAPKHEPNPVPPPTPRPTSPAQSQSHPEPIPPPEETKLPTPTTRDIRASPLKQDWSPGDSNDGSFEPVPTPKETKLPTPATRDVPASPLKQDWSPGDGSDSNDDSMVGTPEQDTRWEGSTSSGHSSDGQPPVQPPEKKKESPVQQIVPAILEKMMKKLELKQVKTEPESQQAKTESVKQEGRTESGKQEGTTESETQEAKSGPGKKGKKKKNNNKGGKAGGNGSGSSMGGGSPKENVKAEGQKGTTTAYVVV